MWSPFSKQEKAPKPTDEIGVSGVKIASGYVVEEFLPELSGDRGRKMYREMADNDAVIGAILYAIDMALRSADWKVEAPEEATPEEAEQYIQFLESVIDDMSHTWEDTISEILTMLPYGWSYFEEVYKVRKGPYEKDPSKRSKFSDGRIGIRKIAPRAQATLNRWEIDEDGGVNGLWQDPPMGGPSVFIPIEKSLLFRTRSGGGNPEGRALDPDTPIPTPDGWRKMDDLAIGSKVFDEKGKIRYVTARADWEDRPCYEVVFSDGSSIIADANHQWVTQTGKERYKDGGCGIRTTEEILQTLKFKGKTSNHSIQWADPLDYPEQSLLVHPYYLGLWLGDGNSRSSQIATNAWDIEEQCSIIEECGYQTDVEQNGRENGNGRTIKVHSGTKWDSRGPQSLLRAIGVIQNKHIPDAYLRGSIKQRTDLLAGLMDSDGYIDEYGRCEFTNTNENLAYGVLELVRSLGFSARITPYSTDHGTPAWAVKFTPDNWSPFKLSRKTDRVGIRRARKNFYIVDVKPVSNRRTVCIEVDSPSHMFLAGESMIPTHNSILRNSYKSYHILKNTQMIEAIGIERELAGLPVVRIPAAVINGTDAASRAQMEAYKKVARDLKFNEQGALIIPSNTYRDNDGNPTSERMVDIELMSSSGTRAIDTGATIRRYQQDIAMSVLAEVILLGMGQSGNRALGDTKLDMFNQSLQGYLNSIAAVFNRFMIPRLWKLNGFKPETAPTLKPGSIAPVDLAELGEFVNKLAGAGAPLFPDNELENYMRDKAGWPEKEGE